MLKTSQETSDSKMEWIFWILSAIVLQITLTNAEVHEYCENNVFEPVCEENEVILITHARYGRMRLGHCITGHHGKVGCMTDAEQYLDAVCSGRRTCSITVATLVPEDAQACSRDLRSYLEVAYECVKVVYASREYCENSEAVEVRESRGYLSSLITLETGCGSLDSPWWVTVEPGQTISLTLLDFSIAQKEPSISNPVCHVYAVINNNRDQGSSQGTETVCAGNLRERHVFTSDSNRLEVRLVARNKESVGEISHFLLKFEAEGCPDIPKPVNGWVKQDGTEALTGCDDNKDVTYRLVCEGTKWTGKSINCSEGGLAVSGPSTQQWTFLGQKHGLSVLIILLIAVVVGLCILAIGLLHIKRKRRSRDHAQQAAFQQAPELQYGPNRLPEKPVAPTVPRQYSKTGDSTEFYHSTENDYYRTWQLQKHAPQQMQPLPAVPSTGFPPPYSPNSSNSHQMSASVGSSGYQKSTYPPTEHIYESPKFTRKDYSSDDYEIDGIHTEYFELDPDSNKMT